MAILDFKSATDIDNIGKVAGSSGITLNLYRLAYDFLKNDFWHSLSSKLESGQSTKEVDNGLKEEEPINETPNFEVKAEEPVPFDENSEKTTNEKEESPKAEAKDSTNNNISSNLMTILKKAQEFQKQGEKDLAHSDSKNLLDKALRSLITASGRPKYLETLQKNVDYAKQTYGSQLKAGNEVLGKAKEPEPEKFDNDNLNKLETARQKENERCLQIDRFSFLDDIEQNIRLTLSDIYYKEKKGDVNSLSDTEKIIIMILSNFLRGEKDKDKENSYTFEYDKLKGMIEAKEKIENDKDRGYGSDRDSLKADRLSFIFFRLIGAITKFCDIKSLTNVANLNHPLNYYTENNRGNMKELSIKKPFAIVSKNKPDQKIFTDWKTITKNLDEQNNNNKKYKKIKEQIDTLNMSNYTEYEFKYKLEKLLEIITTSIDERNNAFNYLIGIEEDHKKNPPEENEFIRDFFNIKN